MQKLFTMFCRSSAVALELATAAAPAAAQMPSLAQLVEKGQKVEVQDDRGDEFRGRIEQLSNDRLTLRGKSGRVGIEFDRIVLIQRPKDTLVNGTLIGLGIGAVVGLVAAAADDCRADALVCYDGPGFAAGTTLVGAGLGAAVGVGVDALVRHDRLIYRRGTSGHAHLRLKAGRGSYAAALTMAW